MVWGKLDGPRSRLGTDAQHRKSQLAIEHCYRTAEQSPAIWVFWVHASNAARFEQSFRDIADLLKLVGRKDPQANIFKLVYDWLLDKRKGEWVLILDNVDDAQFLLSTWRRSQGSSTNGAGNTTRPLRDYIPYCEHGSVLVTSRDRDAALKLVEQRDIIHVEPMEETDALRLFGTKSAVDADEGDVIELVAALEYMPLAIVQAAAYISQRAPRYSVRKYLEEFRSSDQDRTTLLDYGAGELRRDREAKNSVIITWQISFDHVRRTRPSAADLLSIMSFFDRQGIPEALIRCQKGAQRVSPEPYRAKGFPARFFRRLFHRKKSNSKGQQEHRQSGDDRDVLEDDLLTLRNYSFIAFADEGTTFEMHALVQLATRKWLEANNKFGQWQRAFLANLCTALPIGEYKNWSVCQALFPHAEAAFSSQPEDRAALEIWASVLFKAAWYASEMGQYSRAYEMGSTALRTREAVLGPEHADTLNSLNSLGLVVNSLGRYDEAKAMHEKALEAKRRVLGADHPSTLTSMANLASTYWKQGRWVDAKALFVQVMETFKTKLGADHPDTLTSMANLASTYREQGRWADAEALDVQVMETFKTKLGADHPDTLTSMNNLAFTFKGLGKVKEAFSLMQDCCRLQDKVLGSHHPYTLSSQATLAAWQLEAIDSSE